MTYKTQRCLFAKKEKEKKSVKPTDLNNILLLFSNANLRDPTPCALTYISKCEKRKKNQKMRFFSSKFFVKPLLNRMKIETENELSLWA